MGWDDTGLDLNPVGGDHGRWRVPGFQGDFKAPDGLRRAWAAAINKLETTPSPHPPREVWSAAFFARKFVTAYGDFAEMAGMQPAHLVSYLATDRRGLAWRWTPRTELICFPRLATIVVCEFGQQHDRSRVYEFARDGGCIEITGTAFVEIMGAQITLERMPTQRARALAVSVQADRELARELASKTHLA